MPKYGFKRDDDLIAGTRSEREQLTAHAEGDYAEVADVLAEFGEVMWSSEAKVGGPYIKVRVGEGEALDDWTTWISWRLASGQEKVFANVVFDENLEPEHFVVVTLGITNATGAGEKFVVGTQIEDLVEALQQIQPE